MKYKFVGTSGRAIEGGIEAEERYYIGKKK